MIGGTELHARFEEARQRWPKVDLPEGKFAAYVSERSGEAGSLEQRRAEELYLACACVEGMAPAIAELERHYFSVVRQKLMPMNLGTLQDDVMQMLRERLLMPSGTRRPRLAEYAGRGALQAWLSVLAVRLALDELDRKRPEVLVEDVAQTGVEALATDPSFGAELGPVPSAQRAIFKRAFEGAFATLTVRQQNLLQQQIVDGLSIDDLGALYQVHRATAARWLKEIRVTLVHRTREEMQNAGLTRSACEQILMRAQSQLDLSLTRLFAATALKSR